MIMKSWCSALTAAFGLIALSAGGAVQAQTVVLPDWQRRPSGDDLANAYPDRAMRAGIEGRVTVVLELDETGAVVGCTPQGEQLGYGLEEATCGVLTRRARFRPRMLDGQGVPGTIRVPILWALPEDAPPPPIVQAGINSSGGNLQNGVSVFECSFDPPGSDLFGLGVQVSNGSFRNYVGHVEPNVDWGYDLCDGTGYTCRLTADEFYFRSGSTEARIDRRTGHVWEHTIINGRITGRIEGTCREGEGPAPPGQGLAWNTYVGTGGFTPVDATGGADRDYGGGGTSSGGYSRYSGSSSGSSSGYDTNYMYCLSFRQEPGTEPSTYFSDIFVQPSHGYTGLIASTFTAYITASYDARPTVASGGSCNHNLPSLQAAQLAFDSDVSEQRVDGREVVLTGWWPEF